MPRIERITHDEQGLSDPRLGTLYRWSELECVDVAVSHSLTCRGLRPTCRILLAFSRGRRVSLEIGRSWLTGLLNLAPAGSVVRHALAAAPPSADFSRRSRGIARWAGVQPDLRKEFRRAKSGADLEALLRASDYFVALFEHHAADRSLRAAREIEPYDTRVLLLWANWELDRGMPASAALPWYGEVLRRDPSSSEAKKMQALLLLVNDDQRGEQLGRPLAADTPGDPEVGLALAQYFVRKCEFEEARKTLFALQAHSPHSCVQDEVAVNLRRIDALPPVDEWRKRLRRKGVFRKTVATVSVVCGIVFMLAAGASRVHRLAWSVPPAAFRETNVTQLVPYGGKPDDDRFSSSNSLPSLQFNQSATAAGGPNSFFTQPPGAVGSSVSLTLFALQSVKRASSAAEFAHARELLKGAAATGDPQAMTSFGIVCEEGIGGKQDIAAAEQWLQKSADSGYAAGMYFYGDLIARKEERGRSGETSDSQGQLLMRRAADGGFKAVRKASPKPAAAASGDLPVLAPDAVGSRELSEAMASGSTRIPKVISQVGPEYPLSMRFLQINGKVVVEFIVDRGGLVRNARAFSSTLPQFEPAAIEAIQSWRFIPGIKNGKAVDTRMQVPVIFSLQ